MPYGKKKHGGMHSGKVSKTGQAGMLGQFSPKRMDDKRHAKGGHPVGGSLQGFSKSKHDPTSRNKVV